MAGLYYIGPTTDGRDAESRQHTEDELTSGFSRLYVTGRVSEKVALRASKTYTDAQDSTYAPVAYYPAQDALLVPNNTKGAVNGVATLGNDGKLPAAQTPVLGAGFVKGPYGPNSAFGGSTGATPLKIAQWNTVGYNVIGVPWAYLNTSVLSDGGRPVLEIRIGTSTQTAYADQTLIAQGFGRSLYNDWQMVTALPADADLGEGQDGVQDNFDPAQSYIVNAWLFDDVSGHTVQTTNASIASASLFWVRTAL